MINISTDKLEAIIMMAREYDAQVPSADLNSGSNPIDDMQIGILESGEGVNIVNELKNYIDGLREDEQLDLVALTWIGRGTYEPENFEEAKQTATAERTAPTSDYLMGIPLLADYLAQGLAVIDQIPEGED